MKTATFLKLIHTSLAFKTVQIDPAPFNRLKVKLKQASHHYHGQTIIPIQLPTFINEDLPEGFVVDKTPLMETAAGLPSFGDRNNVYSKEDHDQVDRNSKIINLTKDTLLKASLEEVPKVHLKSAFAPGPTPFYDYSADVWFDFEYKNVRLMASGLVYSSDRQPPNCDVYNPEVAWVKRDFKNICQHLKTNLPENIKTDCGVIDVDRNGGTCNNYRALMSFENVGKPDVWLNQAAWNFRASNDPQSDCNLHTYHEYSTVVYACRKNDKVFKDEDSEHSSPFEFQKRARLLENTPASVQTLQVNGTSQLMNNIFAANYYHPSLYQRFLTHGCWCTFIGSGTGYRGHPSDKFDEFCRDHNSCTSCSGYKNAPCQDNNIHLHAYKIDHDLITNNWVCSSNQDPCQKARCECDLDFVLNLVNHISYLGTESRSGDGQWETLKILHQVYDESECPKKGENLKPLPGVVFSPRGAESFAPSLNLQLRNGGMPDFGETKDREHSAAFLKQKGKVNSCCGRNDQEMHEWKPYSDETHHCSSQGEVLKLGESSAYRSDYGFYGNDIDYIDFMNY